MKKVSQRQWEKFSYKPGQISTLLLFTIIAIFISFSLFCGGSIRLIKYSKNDSENTVKEASLRLNCVAWNRSKTCPKLSENHPRFSSSESESCPEYFRWIHEDLRRWKKTGITDKMVAEAEQMADFRLTILEGKMYVQILRESFQSRALFTLWGFAQLMRRHGGKLPDLDLMFNTGDRPMVAEEKYKGDTIPPPLFKYCSDNRSLDIVFPDWSFWGWAEVNIKPWRRIVKEMKESNGKVKWEEREAYAYWKGNPLVSQTRSQLAKCNFTHQNQTDWNVRLYSVNWEEESRGGFKHSNLANQCTHRYKIYAQGWGWSVSKKYILACNSPVLAIDSRFYDFYTRGMIPQLHYWPIRKHNMCSSLKFAVDWGNNHLSKAKAIGEAGSRFVFESLKMEHVYSYMFHLLNEYAKLLTYTPKVPANATLLCSELMVCPAVGNWRKFMEETLEDSPSDSPLCAMPTPYESRQLHRFVYAKMEAIKEVEAWEDEYWRGRIHHMQ